MLIECYDALTTQRSAPLFVFILDATVELRCSASNDKPSSAIGSTDQKVVELLKFSGPVAAGKCADHAGCGSLKSIIGGVVV